MLSPSQRETARLDALRHYRLLDTAPESAFDDFTLAASELCGTPIAAISLIDQDRQWFKSITGLAATETPREHAFCAHTILQEKVMVVEDARTDQRFAANPLVTSDPHIRFYAGAPLIDRQGHALGSLCVIDRAPRHLSARQIEALAAISRRLIHQIEARTVAADLATALEEARTLRSLLPICSHCKAIRNDHDYWQSVDSYLHEKLDADFSHAVCDHCIEIHHPVVFRKMQADRLAAAQSAPPQSTSIQSP